MIIVSVEGVHGCGKTTLVKEFQKRGFNTLDEAFVDMPSYSLHPQSLLMETIWVSRWCERLLQHDADLRRTQGSAYREAVFIADRSPFSAELYARRGGSLLGPIIREHLLELSEQADIHVYTVHVQVDEEILWSRIQRRLAAEPEREKFNEGSRAWMEKARAFYGSKEWDFVVDNSRGTVEDAVMQVVRQIGSKSQRFRVASPVKFRSVAIDENAMEADEDRDVVYGIPTSVE